MGQKAFLEGQECGFFQILRAYQMHNNHVLVLAVLFKNPQAQWISKRAR
jgi:hypothetical protein